MNIPATILVERARQVSGEGWTPEHDDQHDNGELLAVATLYWQRAIGVPLVMETLHYQRRTTRWAWRFPLVEEVAFSVPVGFPWEPWWWKPREARRDLERAGALCLAEIDRLNRAGRAIGHVEQKLARIIEAYEGLGVRQ